MADPATIAAVAGAIPTIANLVSGLSGAPGTSASAVTPEIQAQINEAMRVAVAPMIKDLITWMMVLTNNEVDPGKREAWFTVKVSKFAEGRPILRGSDWGTFLGY